MVSMLKVASYSKMATRALAITSRFLGSKKVERVLLSGKAIPFEISVPEVTYNISTYISLDRT